MSKTVYIVGAGASAEAGLPTGESLKSQIATALDFEEGDINNEYSSSNVLLRAIENVQTENPGEYAFKKASEIARNLPLATSIDNYVDSRRDDERIAEIAKLTITYLILKAERESLLYNRYANQGLDIDFKILSETWYVKLFRLMTQGRDIDQLAEAFEGLTFVIFNYDRVIEQFLYDAVISFYSVSPTIARQTVSKVTFIHPYGTVGSMEWDTEQREKSTFGELCDEVKLARLAKSLYTFTEGMNSLERNEISHRLEEAGNVIFLGFAFHPINMEVLKSPEVESSRVYTNVYTTTFAMSKHNSDKVQQSVQSVFKRLNYQTASLECSKFFDYFSHSLADT